MAGERGPGDVGDDGRRPRSDAGGSTKLSGRPGGGRSVLGAFGLVGQLGLTVVTGGLVGGLAGYGLDAWLGTAPGFSIGGMLFGLAGGAVGAYRLIARHLKD